MNTLKELSEAYAANHMQYEATQDKIAASIRRLEKRREMLRVPSWIDDIIAPLANQIGELYPDRTVEILGPFGLSTEVSVHLIRKGASSNDADYWTNGVLSVTFVPGNLDSGEIMVRDYNTDTHKYPEQSIGAINGMNHPSVLVETIEDIVKWIR